MGMVPADTVLFFGGTSLFGRGLVAGGSDEGGERCIADFKAVDGKGVHLDLAAGFFVGGSGMVESHGEWASGYGNGVAGNTGQRLGQGTAEQDRTQDMDECRQGDSAI